MTAAEDKGFKAFLRKFPGGFAGLLLLAALAFLLIAVLVTSVSSCSNKEPAAEAPAREKLSEDAVSLTDYYRDEIGFITDENALLPGLEAFYKATGIQPCLYFVKGDSAAALQALAEDTYDGWFNDQGHFLLVYGELGEDNYYLAYCSGIAASLYLGEQGTDYILNAVEEAYAKEKLTNEAVFSRAFSSAAKALSPNKTAIWPFILIAAALLFGTVYFLLLRRSKKKKRLHKSPARPQPQTKIRRS